MLKIKRYFNRNIKKVLITILILVMIIIFIQVLNKIAKDKKSNTTNTEISKNSISDEQRTTAITKDVIEEEKNTEIVSIISDFVNKCNNKQLEEAYNMLSTECKQQVYPSMENFKKSYYDIVFSTQKEIDVKSWIIKNNIYTYKVSFTEDLMANKNAKQTEDYYSIVKENDENKLNINGFIGSRQINKEKMINNINIKIKKVYTYMEYEDYDIEINNNLNNKIILDTKEKTTTMYIADSNGNKYYSKNYQLSKFDLEINAKSSKELNISFNKGYNSNVTVKKIGFLNIQEINNKKDNKIEIDL